MHSDGSIVDGVGTMRVCRGTNVPARWLATLLGLAAAGDAVSVTLTIKPSANEEEWVRSFSGKPMVTRQRLRPGGILAERAGLSELRFRLEVRDGGLHFHPVGVSLVLGWLMLPLPRWLAPSVTARELPTGRPDETEVSVVVSLPILGLLISYEGLMTRRKQP
jgi:hypothetical protein